MGGCESHQIMVFRQILFLSSALFSFWANSASVDTITADQTIRDNDTIISPGEMYELGFFSPGNSKYRYLGIWYKKVSPQTVVWVANREVPLTGTSGVFRVNSKGTLLILSGNNSLIWSSNSSVSVSNVNIVAKLLDSGNFVVHDNSSSTDQDFIWQSFDYPGDTLLAGMKFGKDLITGRDWSLTSWKSLEDPSPGLYETRVDTNGYPQYFHRRGSVLELRFGPWNGVRFSGFPSKPNSFYAYEFVFNQKEVYVKYDLINSPFITRLYLTPEGHYIRLNWINPTQGWIPYLATTVDTCSRYGLCGTFGSCNIYSSPACSCMDGFKPRQPDEWNAASWSGGCQRKNPLKCGNDGFRKLSGVKLPDTRHSWYSLTMSLVECEESCKRNCSCTAYANLDMRRGGSGCLLWFNDLMDIRENDENQDIFIRMAASELSAMESGFNKEKIKIEVVLATLVVIVLVGLALAVYAWKKKLSRAQRQGHPFKSLYQDHTGGVKNKDAELPLFSFAKISKLTNNFSINNKLGEGGFGPVYKGVMDNGVEIAVKRLSDTSRQGLDEFKNEVACKKLQHRNLVQILGFCAKKNEVILIYEYMPNRSLDTILFDETKSSILDWSQRFCIIKGIARGLLYLHEDSHIRIIHRDLKAANILLDDNMIPKISDFGLARRFEGYETGANTDNVVGTCGYMPPEYVNGGAFSVKSDMFSFGVLVLEIVSGMKNRDNLLGYAWRLFKDEKSHELVAASSHDSCITFEVSRSVHVGLLCVQNDPEDRPTISQVVEMWGPEVVLPQPKPPAFFNEPNLDPRTTTTTTMSVNDVTVSLRGR